MNEVPITRHQGETFPVELNMKDAGIALPVTGFTFELIVNPKAAPTPADGDLFTSAGTIVDADAGIVHFPVTAEQADYLGRYYHRVRMADPGGKSKTVLYGPYLLLPRLQPLEGFVWTPPTAPVDGTPAVVDGSEHLFAESYYSGMAPVRTYETQDARRVIRLSHTTQSAWTSFGYFLFGPQFPRKRFDRYGWEWKLTAYLNLAKATWEWNDGVYSTTQYNILELTAGAIVATYNGAVQEIGKDYVIDNDMGTAPLDTTGWPSPGWYTFGNRVDENGIVWQMIKPEASPDAWQQIHAAPVVEAIFPVFPYLWFQGPYPDDPTAFLDLWKIEWRRTD